MTFKKNMKIVAIMALIFIVLKLIACGISAGISEIPNKEMINLIAAIVSLPISLILVVIFSFI